MHAAVVTRPGRVEVVQMPEPRATADAAVLAVEAGGICGTDLKVLRGEIPVRVPLVMGHELVGRVVSAPDDSGLAPGTRVVVDPSSACGTCRACRRGRPQLCAHGGLMGRDENGGFAELVVVPLHRLHPLPAGLSGRDSVMIQVLSTCVHAQSLARPQLGSTAVVVGLGVTGLLHVQLLRASGVRTIAAVSRSPKKRALASELGATVVASPDDATAVVAELTEGEGVDLAIESAGVEATLRLAMSLAGAGGTVLLFGTVTPAAEKMPTYEWYRKELLLVNTRASRPRDFTVAIDLVRSGQITPGVLVTASYPLTEIGRAVQAIERPEQLKVVITPRVGDPIGAVST